jgi:hypothetical protein
MKWSGAICMEIELVLVEVHTEITNTGNQVNELHKEKENK